MGYYIQCRSNWDKAEQIVKEHDAIVLSGVKEAEAAFNSGLGVVCVVQNGMFDAAGFCYSRDEFEMWADRKGQDRRRRTWLAMDRDKAEKLSGYKQ